MENILIPSSYLFAVLIFFVGQACREINRLSEDSGSSLLRGQPFLLLLWPLVIIVSIWLVAPLTLGQKPPGWASVYAFLFFSEKIKLICQTVFLVSPLAPRLHKSGISLCMVQRP